MLLLKMPACVMMTEAERAVNMAFEEGAAYEAYGGEGEHYGEDHGLEDVRRKVVEEGDIWEVGCTKQEAKEYHPHQLPWDRQDDLRRSSLLVLLV